VIAPSPVIAAPALAARAVQRRTVRLLFVTQIIGGIGVTIGITVGALLAARLAGVSVSGAAQSSAVVGGALLAVPATRLMRTGGRRAGLILAYLCGAAGSVLILAAALTNYVPALFAGMFFFGGGTTANLQARYAAVDLAEPARRGRQLSLIVWATTLGAVTAPNLASLADRAVSGWGIPELAGPFVFSLAAFLLDAVAIALLLRPDPLLTARALAAGPAVDAPALAGPAVDPPPAAKTGMRAAARVVWSLPQARLGLAAVAMGHLVMVGVMSMTPVHLGEIHHGDLLRIVGLVLSVHIAGMYALSPVVGWLTDRIGRHPVILTGVALLIGACAVAGTAGHETPRFTAGLALLGLGWSCLMVAGSTLLSESVPAAIRPTAQGLSDLTMGLAGASSGAVAGVVVATAGYPVLTLLAGIAIIPLLALVLGTRRPAIS
jgi:MFS family permease